MQISEWNDLSSQVAGWEREGMTLSDAWFHFGEFRTEEAERLLELQNASLSSLTRLSSDLDAWIKEHPRDQRLEDAQYAYQLIQELIQSRSANTELLQNMLSDASERHPEFGRALAIKERAAWEQANTLQHLVQRLQ